MAIEPGRPAHPLHILGMDLESLSRAGALERLQATSPAAVAIFGQWQDLRDEVARAKSADQKQRVVAHYLQRNYSLAGITLERAYRRLHGQIRAARKALTGLFEEYLPSDIADLIQPQLPILALDPVALIELGLPASDGQLALEFEREQFEARQALLLGLLFFDITVERWSGRDPVGDLEQLTGFLVREGVLTKPPRERLLDSFHDPEQEFRYVGLQEFQEPADQTGLIRRKNRLPIGRLRLNNGATRDISIVYTVRKKVPISLIRRMLVDNEWDPQRVRDLRAFRFCYFAEEDLLSSWPRVARRLGSLGSFKDRFTAGGMNPNQHSAPDFRGIKHQARILGRTYEVDHMLASTWFDIACSKGAINHDLYHARQMWETNPPGLWLCVAPQQVYGVNWESEEIRRRIKEHILARATLPHTHG